LIKYYNCKSARVDKGSVYRGMRGRERESDRNKHSERDIYI